jgi:hypothetical protein
MYVMHQSASGDDSYDYDQSWNGLASSGSIQDEEGAVAVNGMAVKLLTSIRK